MGDWDSLNNPSTTTGVMQRPDTGPQAAAPVHIPVAPQDVHPLNEIQHRPPSPPAPSPPSDQEQTLNDKVANAVGRAMTQQFALQEQQAAAVKVVREADDEERKEAGRKKLFGWIVAALAGLGVTGGGGTYYVKSQEPTPQETVPALMEQRTTTLERDTEDLREDVDTVQADTDANTTALTEHTEDQRKENMAAKLRGVRQEIMLETLLRAGGKTPPEKPPELKKAEAAVGLGDG